MKAMKAIAGAVALVGLGDAAADAAVLAQWTFETSIPTTAGPHSPEVGTGSGLGNTGGTWSNPVGNGSAESFSSNTWDVGDYFEFSTSSVGYEDITISFDATGSNTGPRDFKVAYSTDGSSFTDFSTYTVLFASPAWNGTTHNPTHFYSVDLSAVSALDNDSSIYFRLIDTSTVSVNGGTVAVAGTSRIDNFTISGTEIPEPTTLGLLGFGGLALLRRQRRS